MERLSIAKKELVQMLEEEELKDATLLVFANKQVCVCECVVCGCVYEFYTSQKVVSSTLVGGVVKCTRRVLCIDRE